MPPAGHVRSASTVRTGPPGPTDAERSEAHNRGIVLPERIEGSQGLLLRRWVTGDAEALARAVAESAEHLRPWMEWIATEPPPIEPRREMLGAWEREWAQGGDAIYGVFVDD